VIKYRTPHEQIDLAITKAIKDDAEARKDLSLAVPDLNTDVRRQITDVQRKHLKELQNRSEIPHFKDLVLAEANSTLQARRHLEMLRKARVHQTVEREINYCPEPNRVRSKAVGLSFPFFFRSIFAVNEKPFRRRHS
jgi:hypothetical protein